MDQSELSLFAVFLTGLLGGVHCAGMCGGIVSALGLVHRQARQAIARVPVTVVSTSPALRADREVNAVAPSVLGTVLLYNAGRLFTYAMLGALAGAVGSLAWLMQSVLPIQKTAFLISNLLLIVMGLYLFGFKRVAVVIESMGSRLWKQVRPAATRRLQGTGAVNYFMAGSLWGLVPCGMVYAVLGASLVSGSALQGALLMVVFGLGTLPNLVALGLSGSWLARASKRLWVRRTAGVLVLSFGLFGLMHLMMMHST